MPIRRGIVAGQAIPNSTPPTMTTTAGSDATTTPTAPTTSAPTSTQSFGTLNTQTYTSGSGTWTNPYPSGATTGTGTLNGSAGTTNFVWGTTSGSYPNEVSATSNAYVRTTWPRGTAVYYKARATNTSCIATFNGTANPNGADTTVTFEYGTISGTYPFSVSAGTVSGITTQAVTANLSTAAKTIYFRTKGVNSQGTTYGSEQSITVSAKSATAASEQSFTPPTVGTLYEIVCAGGGGQVYSGTGGGGGAVAYYSSATAPATLNYALNAPVSTPAGGGSANVGGTTTVSFTGVSMTATGGGVPSYPGGYDQGGSSGVASGGTSNYPASAYTSGTGYNIGDSDYGNAAGSGAGGSGTGGQTFSNQSTIYAYGGNGGAAVTINYPLGGSNTFGAGGGGYGDVYTAGGPGIGNSPYSDYGRGGFRNQNYSEVAPTGGLVRFRYYGP